MNYTRLAFDAASVSSILGWPPPILSDVSTSTVHQLVDFNFWVDSRFGVTTYNSRFGVQLVYSDIHCPLETRGILRSLCSRCRV